MRIALFQMNIIWEKKKENYQSLEYRLKSLCEKIDLILLPEMSFTGFSMNTDLTKERNLETASYMTGYAVKYHTAIGFGWVKDCGEKSIEIPKFIHSLFRVKTKNSAEAEI